jgi:ATP-dependent RNA helicase DeaD
VPEFEENPFAAPQSADEETITPPETAEPDAPEVEPVALTLDLGNESVDASDIVDESPAEEDVVEEVTPTATDETDEIDDADSDEDAVAEITEETATQSAEEDVALQAAPEADLSDEAAAADHFVEAEEPAEPADESPESNRVLFTDLGLDDAILDELTKQGYEEPTPIQAEAIPLLMTGRDLLGQAATGTGKTAAFALPVLQGLEHHSDEITPVALILVPTRELAMQVSEAVHKYGRGIGARVLPIYGGQPISKQLQQLRRGVDIVVATPGRAIDHIKRGTLQLQDIGIVILDEADEMLDMGFAEDLEEILSKTPAERQTVLFSATMPPRIDNIIKHHLNDPLHVRIAKQSTDEDNMPLVKQTAYVVRRGDKAAALGRILDVENPEAAIIFCRTRHEVDELTDTLNGRGYRAEALHGGMGQEQRDRAMGRLKAGISDLLIATDVAARGLDIDHLTHVVNYDVPAAPEAYVHRIGRVGRAGREGVAITLAEPREHRQLKNIERLTKHKISIDKVPTIADMRAQLMEITRSSIREAILESTDGNESEENEKYRVVVESLSDDFDLVEIAMAAVRIAHEANRNETEERDIVDAELGGGRGDKRGKYGDRDNRGGSKGKPRSRPSGPMTRLHIDVGRNAGIRPKDLVGAIAGETGLPGNQIGSIEITGKFSLVEVPQDQADHVIDGMSRAKLRGKPVSIRRERG